MFLVSDDPMISQYCVVCQIDYQERHREQIVVFGGSGITFL